MAPGDVAAAENARIGRFLVMLQDMESKRLAVRADPYRLADLARHDSTVSSRQTHDGRTISADPSGSLMAEEEHLRTLRFAPGAVSQRFNSSGGATSLLGDAPPIPSSPKLLGNRAGSGDFALRLSPKGKPRQSLASPEKPKPSPGKARKSPAKPRNLSPIPAPRKITTPARGSSPGTLSRPKLEPEPEPEPKPKKRPTGGTGMPQGEDLGLPMGVSADFLQPFFRQTFPDMPVDQMKLWINRYSECGIYTTQQLLHSMKTRAVSKTVPPDAFWRGRAFLVNELIETCSDGHFLQGSESDCLIQAINARAVRPTGPEVVSTDGLTEMEPVLRMALAATDRLDLRPIFIQLGILGYDALCAATEGTVGRVISVMMLPINIKLREAGEKPLGFELVDALLAECKGELPVNRLKPEPELKPKAVGGKYTSNRPVGCDVDIFSDRLLVIAGEGDMRCWMYGKEGHGSNGQWAMMPKESTTLPGSRKNAADAERARQKPEEPADVILMQGDMPLILAVPHGGLKGSSSGSAPSFKQWAEWTTSRTPHSVKVLETPRGTLGWKVGARICNPEGTVRAVVAVDVDPETAEEIVYLLDPSSPGDFSPSDHIFSANVMWKRKTMLGQDEAVFKVNAEAPKIASVHTSTSPVVELAEAVRQACWDSTCNSPYVVMCNIDPSKVDCGAPLAESVADKPVPAGQTDMRHRASAAWHNYHACIEIAKQEVAKMTGGDALLVEVLVEGHVEKPHVSIGYGVREFDIDLATRPPGQSVKKGIDRVTLLKTFYAFDADGSGAVDADELKMAAAKFGLPMTDDDVAEAMAGLGKTPDDEIDKREFIAWFEGLSNQKGPGGSKMEQIQKNACAAGSSIGFLSRRLGEGRAPADAFIGDYSLGTMMTAAGCPATPSDEAPVPSKVCKAMADAEWDYQSGTQTLNIHGSSDFSGRCDAVNMTLPASIWAKSTDPEVVAKELQDAFAMVDVDGSGEIDAGELRGLAKMLGMRMSDKDIQQAMGEMDEDGSGEVDFEEFAAWWTAQQGEGGKWELNLLATLSKTKRWGDRVGNSLVAMLAHHYRFVLPGGSGAKRREFKAGTLPSTHDLPRLPSFA